MKLFELIVSFSVGFKEREAKQCRRKWTYIKSEVLKKYRLQQNPPTGGGKVEVMSDLEANILDFLLEKKSVTVHGHADGVESQV